MRKAYRISVTKDKKKNQKNAYAVYVPDFKIYTEGRDLADAMYMARDAIGMTIMVREDEGMVIPEPDSVEFEPESGSIVTYVDVDTEEYRKKHDNRAVKKNCTIPYYLNVEAEKAGINFSKVLQEALIKKLKLQKKSMYRTG